MSAQTPQTDEFRRRLFDALGDSPKSRESQWDTYAHDLEADRNRLRALCEELREALEDVRKRSIRILVLTATSVPTGNSSFSAAREQKAIVGIEATFIERVAQDALKKAEKP